jgi:Icc-related predicted phosphoesterase
MKYSEKNCLSKLLKHNLHEFLVVANCDRILVIDALTNYHVDVRMSFNHLKFCILEFIRLVIRNYKC